MSATEPVLSRVERRKQACAERKQEKKQWREEARRMREQGQLPPPRPSPTNAKRSWASVQEEQQDRQQVGTDYLMVMNRLLPGLLKRFARVPDFRQAKKVKHQMDVVLMMGLLSFVLHKASRRQANRDITSAALLEVLQLLFPEFDSLPHHDCVNRVLGQIDVSEIDQIHVDMIRKLIRKKAFARYHVGHIYTVAIDGTQKASLSRLWAEECLEARQGDSTRYYCYVLEANLVLRGGMSVPLMTEFCEFAQGEADKQDCEYRALQRLTARLKHAFPKLKMFIVLDGLYPCGPIFQLLRRHRWDFMITLKRDSLPAVWVEADALREYHRDDPRRRYEAKITWGKREQRFWWVNNIEYSYGSSPQRFEKIHVVVCEERWREPGDDPRLPPPHALTFAWVSSAVLDRGNINQRCNLRARARWCIEESFLVEKHHGYEYSHLFSHNWNAMKGYHLLMRLAHLINELALHSALLAPYVEREGVQAFLRFIERTLTGNWLNPVAAREALSRRYQMRGT